MHKLEFIPIENTKATPEVTFNTFAIANEYNDATNVVEALAKSNDVDINDYEKVIIYEVVGGQYGKYILPVDVIWFHQV